MATRTVRADRSGRAGKRGRSTRFRPLAFVVPAAIMLLTGRYSDGLPSLAGLLFVLVLAVGVFTLGIRRFSPTTPALSTFAGGLAGLTGLFILAEMAGPLRGLVFPAICATVALLAVFHERRIAVSLAAAAVFYEVALWLVVPSDRGGTALLFELQLLVLSAVLPLLRPRTPARRNRVQASLRAPSSPPHGGLDEGFSADHCTLLDTTTALTQATCSADLVAVLTLCANGTSLEVVSSTDGRFLDATLPANLGLPGSVSRTAQPVVANDLKSDIQGIFFGAGEPRPQHAMAAPVTHGRRVVAVLLVQRKRGKPFDGADLDRLKEASRLLSLSLAAHKEVERVTGAHLELERFFQASRMLNSALTPEQVYDSAVEALHTIAPFDLIAITWIGPDGSHGVVHTAGPHGDLLADKRVMADRSLAAMVVKNGHYLPLGGEYRGAAAPVVRPDEGLDRVRSVVVLPLRLHDRVAGTLIVGMDQTDGFSDQRRGMLEVIGNQLTVSLSNARTYARVQALATTDALTGLFNRRMFKERLEEGLARAERSRGPLTLVLLDIDHFKTINDTHGHPVGDQVLRELGAKMADMMRRTDTAARYGGEEFALILEDTDVSGALVMAERLRREAARMVFDGAEGKTFGFTLSLGVAGVGLHADDPDSLVEAADQALYQAKRNGRNQSRVATSRPQAQLASRIPEPPGSRPTP